MIVLLILAAAVLLVVWSVLGSDDTEYDQATRQPVFIPSQRPGGDR